MRTWRESPPHSMAWIKRNRPEQPNCRAVSFLRLSKGPSPRCIPGSHNQWREGWAAIRSAGGGNKGTLVPACPAGSDWRASANSPGMRQAEVDPDSASSSVWRETYLPASKYWTQWTFRELPPSLNIYRMTCLLKNRLFIFYYWPTDGIAGMWDGWLVCIISYI